MTTITISLPDDRLQKLKEIATRFSVAPEELVRVSIEELLTRPEEDFRRG
jgi:predicted transcriptional regulator